MAELRFQEIIVGSREKSKDIGKLEKEGLLKKIAPRLYTSNMEESSEIIVLRNWYRILSDLYPEASLSHRSALERIPTKGGHIYLTHSYTDIIELPGITIHFLKGYAPLSDDELFFGNLKASGLARSYMENLQSIRGNGEKSKTLSREQLEEKLESFVRVKGEDTLNQVRDRAQQIAPELGMEKELIALNQLITDLLGTGLSKNLVSSIAKARVLGEPIDANRIQLFELFYEELTKREYQDHPDKNNDITSYKNFAFFEAYFSNYIEGTEFTIDEAKQIISTATPLPARDEGSQDVLGTYQLVSNRIEMSLQPNDANDLLKLMKDRHAVLLSARTSKKPGQFKI